MKISVIMAVHNGEKYLKEAVESILGQTFHDFEFLIVDDASTDKTSDVLKGYSFKDPRAKIITNEINLGLTKSLNIALREAKGEYVARMDADDISLPERFEKQVKFLDANEDHGVVGAWAKVIDEQGKEIDEFAWETDDISIRKNLIKWNPIIHPLAMVRKNVLEQVGLYDESFRYAQDYELWLRIARVAKVANIAEFLMKYRVSLSSITSSKNRDQAKCFMRAQWKAIRRGQYSQLSGFWLVKSLFGIILPPNIKKSAKKFYS